MHEVKVKLLENQEKQLKEENIMISLVWLIVIGIIFLCEIILINDLEKPNSIVRKIYNRIEYLCDPHKYVAYALKAHTLAWKKIEDIKNPQKAISIDLEKNEDNLVVSHNLIEIGYEKYWKLYLLEGKKNLQIMYVKYDALCLMNPYKV